MVKTTARVYETVLASSNLSLGIMAQAYRWAKTNRDNKLLALLALKVELDSDLDGKLGQEKSAVVKEAWLGRAGRSRETVEAAIKKEKRVGVLAAAGRCWGLRQETYRDLADTSSLKTLEALLLNRSVGLATKKVAAGRWGEMLPQTRRPALKFQPLLKVYPELGDHLSQGITQVDILQDLNPDRFSTLRLEDVVDVMVQRCQTSHNASWTTLVASVDTLDKLSRNPYLTDRQQVTLTNTINVGLANTPKTGYQHIVNKLVEIRHNLSMTRPKVQALDTVTKARETGSQKELERLAQEASHNQDFNLAVAICYNPNVTAQTVRTIVHLLNVGDMEWLCWQSLENTPVLAVLAVQYTHLLDDDLLDKCLDPSDALKHTVQEYVTSRRLVPNPLLVSQHVNLDVLSELPLAQFVIRRNIPENLVEGLGELLEKNLGQDGEKWALFDTLGETFEGPLKELLNLTELTCQA